MLSNLNQDIRYALRQLRKAPGFTATAVLTLALVQKHLAITHLVLSPGGAGIANMQAEYKSGLYLLMAISGLVLLIACANLANLVLVRSIGRASETSLRVALGAQRARILRQMMTESVVLSVIGGTAGLAVAYAGTKMLLSLAFPNSPTLPISATPSLPVVAFAFALSLLTGVIFGIAPAWMTSRAQPAEALLRSAMLQALVGLALGVPVALVCARFVKSQLYQVDGHDWSVLAGATLALACSAIVAGLVPARRAASIDPIEALRTE